MHGAVRMITQLTYTTCCKQTGVRRKSRGSGACGGRYKEAEKNTVKDNFMKSRLQ